MRSVFTTTIAVQLIYETYKMKEKMPVCFRFRRVRISPVLHFFSIYGTNIFTENQTWYWFCTIHIPTHWKSSRKRENVVMHGERNVITSKFIKKKEKGILIKEMEFQGCCHLPRMISWEPRKLSLAVSFALGFGHHFNTSVLLPL